MSQYRSSDAPPLPASLWGQVWRDENGQEVLAADLWQRSHWLMIDPQFMEICNIGDSLTLGSIEFVRLA